MAVPRAARYNGGCFVVTNACIPSLPHSNCCFVCVKRWLTLLAAAGSDEQQRQQITGGLVAMVQGTTGKLALNKSVMGLRPFWKQQCMVEETARPLRIMGRQSVEAVRHLTDHLL